MAVSLGRRLVPGRGEGTSRGALLAAPPSAGRRRARTRLRARRRGARSCRGGSARETRIERALARSLHHARLGEPSPPRPSGCASFSSPFPTTRREGSRSGEGRVAHELSEIFMDLNGLAWPGRARDWFSERRAGPFEIAAIDLEGRSVASPGPGASSCTISRRTGRALVTVDDWRGISVAVGRGGGARSLDSRQTIVTDVTADGARVLLARQSAGGRRATTST